MKQRESSFVLRLFAGLVAFLVAFSFAHMVEAETPQPGDMRLWKDARTGHWNVEVGERTSVSDVVRALGPLYREATGQELTWQIVWEKNPKNTIPVCLPARYTLDRSKEVWTNCPTEKKKLGLIAGPSGRLVIPFEAILETYDQKQDRLAKQDNCFKSKDCVGKQYVALGGTIGTSSEVPPIKPSVNNEAKPGDSDEVVALKAKIATLETENASLTTKNAALVSTLSTKNVEIENMRKVPATVLPKLAPVAGISVLGLGILFGAYLFSRVGKHNVRVAVERHARELALVRAEANVVREPTRALPAGNPRDLTALRQVPATIVDSPASQQMQAALQEGTELVELRAAYKELKDVHERALTQNQVLVDTNASLSQQLRDARNARPAPVVNIENAQVLVQAGNGAHAHAQTVPAPTSVPISNNDADLEASIKRTEQRITDIRGRIFALPPTDPDRPRALVALNADLLQAQNALQELQRRQGDIRFPMPPTAPPEPERVSQLPGALRILKPAFAHETNEPKETQTTSPSEDIKSPDVGNASGLKDSHERGTKLLRKKDDLIEQQKSDLAKRDERILELEDANRACAQDRDELWETFVKTGRAQWARIEELQKNVDAKHEQERKQLHEAWAALQPALIARNEAFKNGRTQALDSLREQVKAPKAIFLHHLATFTGLDEKIVDHMAPLNRLEKAVRQKPVAKKSPVPPPPAPPLEPKCDDDEVTQVSIRPLPPPPPPPPSPPQNRKATDPYGVPVQRIPSPQEPQVISTMPAPEDTGIPPEESGMREVLPGSLNDEPTTDGESASEFDAQSDEVPVFTRTLVPASSSDPFPGNTSEPT